VRVRIPPTPLPPDVASTGLPEGVEGWRLPSRGVFDGVLGVAGPERGRAVATLVLAFSADPFVRWIYPDPDDFLT
jgi:hypothetical protein